VVGLAAFKISLAAVADDPGHGRKGFGVVDGGGFAVQAKTGGKRRLVARLTFFAFQRLQQGGFFATYIGTESMRSVELEREAAAENPLADQAGSTGFVQRFFKT